MWTRTITTSKTAKKTRTTSAWGHQNKRKLNETEHEMKAACYHLRDIFNDARKKREKLIAFWTEKYAEERLADIEAQKTLFTSILGQAKLLREPAEEPGSPGAVSERSRLLSAEDFHLEMNHSVSLRDLGVDFQDFPGEQMGGESPVRKNSDHRHRMGDQVTEFLTQPHPQKQGSAVTNVFRKQSLKEVEIHVDKYDDLWGKKTPKEPKTEVRMGMTASQSVTQLPSSHTTLHSHRPLARNDLTNFSSHRQVPLAGLQVHHTVTPSPSHTHFHFKGFKNGAHAQTASKNQVFQSPENNNKVNAAPNSTAAPFKKAKTNPFDDDFVPGPPATLPNATAKPALPPPESIPVPEDPMRASQKWKNFTWDRSAPQ